MNNLLMISIVIFPIALIIIGLIISRKQDKKRKEDDIKKYSIDTSVEKENDKLVIVKASQSEISTAITEFLKGYNEGSIKVYLRLYVIYEDTFAITFPHDVAFELFCYFVNFMKYPLELDKTLEVTGWATTPVNDEFIKEGYNNTKGMFFVPNDDIEYDNVFLTTTEGKGLKVSFNFSNGLTDLDKPKILYEKPAYDINDLDKYPYKDLK